MSLSGNFANSNDFVYYTWQADNIGDFTAVAIKAALGLPIVNGLFVATNAFGGFLMFTAGASFVWWRHTRKACAFGVLAANLSLLYFSYSRGSEFGLLLGIASFLLLKKRRGSWVAAMVASVVLLEAAILFYTYPIYAQSYNVMELVAQNSDTTKQANILIRALENWPRGLYAFFHSPLFGTGFGSVNDAPIYFSNPVSWFQMNTGPSRIFNSAHAHNTYIQILGEQGIFGFLVFMGFWRAIYRFIRDSRQHVMVRDMLMVSFWALTFASFTEHRIPSPSNALPFTLVLFLFYGATIGSQKAAARLTRQPVI
jgi:O-antigen ligase